MANFLKEEIDHFGERIEKAIEKAAVELSQQRNLTHGQVEDIIQSAADKFGKAIDLRIENAKQASADLISSKLAEFRGQLTDAANEQKKTAIRNASVAVGASIFVGLLSLGYKKILHGDLDLLDVFRSTLLALAVGYFSWIAFRLVYRYIRAPEITKNALIVGAGYLDILKPKSAGVHIVVLVTVFLCWLALSNLEKFQHFFK